ncbi:UDP-N-acetyl-D-glucosamine dehydrogenase [bacterium (Candidatus Blackallbacteria) CG17_big_fil_post_rev_8_21_14_2_50_48_46]|uniref:UDP-N-acetyl-D-glucosamine dehydrogenase n=1 Tax=bacterium (Candidatus Blackallbacteria) CG17_big_fil_post_rev_8_21_14_2_50_48_46 TaxID=2014261 RepID=A0A2M7GAQ0_9BACT|nr:MAG: UDP-N-acetyl-D-glucosamine dehydrogenase [bacterium (Candidatus Blackallbacteria) CG18_big_fil_WC_8_21_14_2_50_49_26]PIW19236.1 MAG: UDP-N-acetyl-D-glucosamine dehydrogenase [bacterium (Candidatus Blackallbacteria) CG17_big_fil_post_rev_8_21_14_2_50_48_46]PIW45504.1 MAG: UDP-N-acetyl-D-glucosamine dehydrogenase [bacterium (Candidatus Blackallbacteria) CG13_big_fil_rev_8_21_14_2_50_49_14]
MSENKILSAFIQKLQEKTARIGIIGLGYVGLPLLEAFSRKGFAVTGVDINPERIQQLQRAESYIQDIPNPMLAQVCAQASTLFTTDFSSLSACDAIIICVPTPLRKSKEPDISYILSAAEKIAEFLHPGHLVILESTTYPGTTDEILLPLFQAKGLDIGKDFMLAFSPERIDPGNQSFQVSDIPKVVGGVTQACTTAAEKLYHQVMEKVHIVSSARVAETSKILENTFRSVNIALVNEFAGICRTLGVDIWEVIDAAATKPFGFMKFLPGPGIGGHCIPLDPHYLIWKSRLHGYEPRFMALAEQINSGMPREVLQLIVEALNGIKKSLNGSKILILGVAYKPDIDDVRESPALELIQLLWSKGAQVAYYDPFVSELQIEKQRLNSIEISEGLLKTFDCGVVITHHSKGVDYSQFCKEIPLWVDTRNALRECQTENTHILWL